MAIDLRKKAAKEFAEYWKNKGDEKQHTQMFWSSLLRDIFEVRRPENFLQFEDRVVASTSTQYEDVWIPSTKVMIEQKSSWKNLDEKIKQADGSYKTAYEQAESYANTVEYDRNPRWIICCNFKEFHIHDMNKNARERKEPVAIIKLEELEKEYPRLEFLVDQQAVFLEKEEKISRLAGVLVGEIYDALIKQYKNPNEPQSQHSLNVLCVRLVFCLYAEDAGLFGRQNMFHDYLMGHDVRHLRQALIDLFKVLNTPTSARNPYLDEDLAAFPYVNGGLFDDSLFNEKEIEIPQLTEEIRTLILKRASEGFDWSEISPTIFGAVFENTLNPKTRSEGGMHYTSIEDIHKVIEPLFLNDLKDELNEIKQLKQFNAIKKRCDELQNKIASLRFLDPAAGSGNFLTESYICLRRLENEIIQIKRKGQETQIQFGFDEDSNPIKVSIQQFYGIEINDFAVTVAKTALWIAESQMMKETEKIIQLNLDFLPLKSYVNIKKENALRLNWTDVLDPRDCNYIMGNPPFVYELGDEQKEDRNIIFEGKGGELDYVACWYKKTAEFIKSTKIKCAFVSTNSICQGQQVYPLWKPLMDNGIIINFAYKSFKWSGEAGVYCIIVAFSYIDNNNKFIYANGERKLAKNINGYLFDAPNVFVEKRRNPLSNVINAVYGIKPADHGFLILNDEEKQKMIKDCPNTATWIRSFITAHEYIHGINRWCLWLVGINSTELNSMPPIKNRVKQCKEWREKQTITGDAFKLKDVPHLMRPSKKFKQQPFIVLPRHTGERSYIPFGFADESNIPGDSVSILPNADNYTFGIISSIVHIAWTRVVAGRLGMSYRYASDIVYNNFIFPFVDSEQKKEIEKTAEAILKARALYQTSSLADMYGENMYLYPELVKAHKANDKAVMKAYGFKSSMTEDEIVAELFKLYEKAIEEEKKQK